MTTPASTQPPQTLTGQPLASMPTAVPPPPPHMTLEDYIEARYSRRVAAIMRKVYAHLRIFYYGWIRPVYGFVEDECRVAVSQGWRFWAVVLLMLVAGFLAGVYVGMTYAQQLQGWKCTKKDGSSI